MNKNLRLSLIAIACSLAITACSSDNKGATRYENLVKNKTEEATKQAEEKAKRAQESETAKKIADLEKKQKELEAELAKKQNGNTAAPSVSGNVPSNVITPSTPAKEKATEKKEPEVKAPSTTANVKVLTAEEAKDILSKGFKDNGFNNEGILKLSGSSAEFGNTTNINSIASDTEHDLNTLIVDGQKVELFSNSFIKEAAKNDLQVGIKDFSNNTGKVGSLPTGHLKYDFEQMRYGYYKTDNGKTILFVQGYMTPETTAEKDKKSPFNYYSYYSKGITDTVALSKMPTEHTYEYQGKAFYGKDNTYQELNSKAYADFTNKKVQIILSDNNEDKLTFGAKINGNQFSGTVDGIVTKGAFFGSEARDLGGIFYQTKGKEAGNNGVYGASKACTWVCRPADVNLKELEIK
ncbi:transferrin-binding protein-like solute binding protein [Actinobacillus equuli subsp. haemolyticus]|uniref:transferrin-binding protein-like solute binding protein n=1 Tax=Actinobacillus equuli TaxID=718 RepID=UPI0024413B1F|nr:transferrin-binding protein-like solute binding protein [Actinobacillus equuli]WGE80733.1 transferrin-binding protein-like solute binding protein [Actinobacillus equuli subsp. haemolyticus]